MTVKLLVLAKSPVQRRIIKELVQQSDGQIEVALYLGGKKDEFKLSSMARMSTKAGKAGHFMADDRYTGSAAALFDSDDYFRNRDLFADHILRESEAYSHKSHKLKDMQDYHDYYHILADNLALKIKDSGATHLLFFNIPHLGYDTLAFQIAQTLGLKTTILFQSLFPSGFFSMRDGQENGNFVTDQKARPVPIEQGPGTDLFYMKGIKQEREDGGRVSAKAMAQFALFLITKRPLQALNLIYLWKTISRMNSVYGALPKWRDPFARFFHENQLDYFDHIIGYEEQNVDLEGDFVYFPLQLQPEMTTSALGERFRDQAYAIERLADILPEGVRILVKENPKQGAYMRGPLFFHRLRRIPSVTLLPSWANTHALTAKAKFVASITGTVGWEAVQSGKPALVFGKAWYRKFPGVFEFRDDLNYEEIISAKFDTSDLEQALGSLLEKGHDGVIDRHYSKIVSDHDEDQNVQKVSETLRDLLLGAQPYTFH